MKVGLLTTSSSSAEPGGQPAHEHGLADAEIAAQQHHVTGGERRRRRPAIARVSASDAERSDAGHSDGAATRRRAVSSSSASPMCADQVPGGHRDFAFVGVAQLAGRAVHVDGDPAGGLRIEQLADPCRDHPGEHVAGAAGGHAG